jgi:putative transposase
MAFDVSTQRACRLIQLQKSSFYYRNKTNEKEAILRKRLRELAASRIRFGYRRLHVMLRREGWMVNHKRIYRLYVEEDLNLRMPKKRKKRVAENRVSLEQADKANQRWSMDFVADRLEDGRTFRILTVVDQYSRMSPLVVADTSMSGSKVARYLSRLSPLPESITVDNGSEFYSKAMDVWAYRNNIQLDFIRPGRPVENGYIESFNGRLRDECLNVHLFSNIEDAQEKLDHWRNDYNNVIPNRQLNTEHI